MEELEEIEKEVKEEMDLKDEEENLLSVEIEVENDEKLEEDIETEESKVELKKDVDKMDELE